MNTALCETVREFFANPWQFHGDTGIMHFLSNRVLTYARRKHCRPAAGAATTSLFQSEHYTALSYLQSGAKEKPGRFDFALVDPSRVPENGDLRKAGNRRCGGGTKQGLRQDGDFAAAETASNVRPGDAVKLIREMRFCGLPLAFLVELYDDPQRAVLAPHVFAAVAEAADDAGLNGLHVIVAVRAVDSTSRV